MLFGEWFPTFQMLMVPSISRFIRNHLPNNIASYPRRLESSLKSPCEPHIFQHTVCLLRCLTFPCTELNTTSQNDSNKTGAEFMLQSTGVNLHWKKKKKLPAPLILSVCLQCFEKIMLTIRNLPCGLVDKMIINSNQVVINKTAMFLC